MLLACVFLTSCAFAAVGQCVDYPDRRRKESEQAQQKRPSQDADLCDPQLLQAPGIIYQPCHRCEETLPLIQIREDRAYLELLIESVADAGANANELDLPTVSLWVGEVRKRVRRLRASLMLPDTDLPTSSMPADARVPSTRIELANALTVLARFSGESLRNPVLSGRVLDQEQSAKALRDLGQIEILAGLIQSGCQTLSKAPR